MPQIFSIGPYVVYFWSDEGMPREPVHVHIAEGVPSKNATKIWITKSRKCIVVNNNTRIPKYALNLLIKIIEGRAIEIISKWQETFGELKFYC